jgi:hypothetical protein
MRIQVLATVTLLLILLSLIPAGAVYAAVGMSPTQGTVGLEVTISGLTDGTSYTIKWDGVAIKSGLAESTGSTSFFLPESYSGEHAVAVESPTGTEVFGGTSGHFTVLPHIAVDPKLGVAGTTATVVGHGFGVNEKNIAITYDGVNIKTGIAANENGYWSTSFSIPASSNGSHAIDASGDITKGTDVTDKSFKISPTWKIDPVAGGVGTLVTVTATGFASAETGLKILYSGKEVRSGITAEVSGSWSTSFAVPSSTRGSHIVNASGDSTAAKDTGDLIFTVAPACNINPKTGYVEDTVKIDGSGFANNETSIEVTFDGNPLASNIVADDSGFWSTSIKLPPCVNGPHTVSARGRMTAASEVSASTFTTQSQITAVPKGGGVGIEIRITGSGFSGSKDFNISFENTSVISGTANDSGSFAAIFKAPAGKSGPCNITATDIKNVTASTIFNMETTPPEVPKISSPKDGATVGFMGDTKVSFSWTAVADPSGVFYSIEVSDQPNFVKTLISHSKLTDSKYTLTEAEAVPNGEYYWRVRAIDGAGNASDWTPAAKIKAGFITTGMLISIGVGVIVLIIVIVVLNRLPKKKQTKRDWE